MNSRASQSASAAEGGPRIAIVLYPECDELDVIGPYEVFRIAAEERSAEVLLAGTSGAVEIEASHGAVISGQASLHDDGWDLVVVPGGGWARQRGAYVEARRDVLPTALSKLHEDGAVIASVCTGAMILAAAGLTTGRPATTHHVALADLAASGAQVLTARVVDDGDVVTCGGVTAGIDLALWMVERTWDAGLAGKIAGRLEYEREPDVHRGPSFGRAESRLLG